MKKKVKSCKQEIIDVILRKRTFDLDKSNQGYPTIHWLVGEAILEDLTPWERYHYLNVGRIKAIKNNFDNAIKEIEEVMNIPVYKGPKDTKKIIYLTLDIKYRNAKEEDYMRITLRAEKYVDSARKKIERKHQDCLPDFNDRFLLPFG